MKCARFTRPARREFLAQVAYFEMKEPGPGARFSDAVEQTTARALALPFASAPASENARCVFVRHLPFSVVYRPEPDGILIVAIAHHLRRQEYWHLRVQDVAPPAEHELPDRRLMYNPNTVLSLGDDGNVYPKSILIGPWGRLTLREGGALAPPNRDRARVAAPGDIEQDDRGAVTGPGWI